MNPMKRALAALTTAALLHATIPHTQNGTGTEGIDRKVKPHAGTLRDVGSTPTVSTTTSSASALQLRQTGHPNTNKVSKQRASRAYRTPAQARALTIRLAHRHGLHGIDTRCLLTLWTRESNFRPQARNKHSGAGGIPQILGLDPATPTHQQIERGLTYIAHRYGSPCQALRHHDRRGWY